MEELPIVTIRISVDGDTTDADTLFVSKTITGTGAEYILTGPLARAMDFSEQVLAYERREARALALEEAAKRIGSGHRTCCDPAAYDRGECCGAFIDARDAIRALKEPRP